MRQLCRHEAAYQVRVEVHFASMHLADHQEPPPSPSARGLSTARRMGVQAGAIAHRSAHT